MRSKGKRRFFKCVLGLMFLGIACISVYLVFLSWRIESRFASRRWSIPSTVYSDGTLVYPGQRVDKPLFLRHLKHLEYQEDPQGVFGKGKMRIREDRVDIFLHDWKFPRKLREGFPVSIYWDGDRIQEIIRQDTQEPLTLLELEPEVISFFFGPQREKRQLVSLAEVPEHLKQAVLAAEDSRFYQHHGVDPLGILRALWINIRSAGIRQGGSTLTQQLAKNYFLTPDRTFTRKFKELLMALAIEARFSKNDILEIYLNEIYFGQKGSISINGVGEAASFYFAKSVKDLTLPESATLAGMIKAPNVYSPYIHPERSRVRRNWVMASMHELGWLSLEDLKKYQSLPIKTAEYRPAFRKAPYFVDYVADQLAQMYSPEDLASLGLSIYTTLDPQVQMAVETALENGLNRLERLYPNLKKKDPGRQLQGAAVVMSPKTGHILALVGGRDYGKSQYNRAVAAKRQAGSLFKPFVALAALDQFPPTTRLFNGPKVYTYDHQKWMPKNYSETSELDVTMRRAIQQSYNRATVDLAMKTGLSHILDVAADFEFTTPIHPYPSMALGAFEMIPLEIARAYCVFAADGVLPYPLSLKKVTDESGTVLEQRHMNIVYATSPEKAFLVTDMLRSVVDGGTAKSLRDKGIYFPVAGKTGTTNDYKDAWFVGYTPDILALVWVGFDNGDPVGLSGAMACVPIWADFMDHIPQYVSEKWFKVPEGITKLKICTQTGMMAKAGCPEVMEEYFLKDQAPDVFCNAHGEESQFDVLFKKIWGMGK